MHLVIKGVIIYFVGMRLDLILLRTGSIFVEIQPFPMTFDLHTRKPLSSSVQRGFLAFQETRLWIEKPSLCSH